MSPKSALIERTRTNSQTIDGNKNVETSEIARLNNLRLSHEEPKG